MHENRHEAQPQPRHNRDNRRQGGGRDHGERNASYALQITECKHDPHGSTLVVEVQAVRGNSPARTLLVELLVDDVVQDADTTTYSGSVKFLLRNLQLPTGKHHAKVRAVGVVGNNAAHLIIQAAEVFDVLPTSLVPSHAVHVSVQCEVEPQENSFAVTCIVTTTRDGISVPNVEVDLVGFTNDVCRLQTGDKGSAKTVFHFPASADGTKQLVPFQAIVVESGTVFTDVLPLIPLPAVIPSFEDFGAAIQQTTLGTYHVRVKAEDKDGQPLKGVRFVVSGAAEPVPYFTDKYGEALLKLVCIPEKDMTNFVVDIPGTKKSKVYDLPSERGQQVHIRKTETKLSLGASIWQHAKQAFRRGAGGIRYTSKTSSPDEVSADPLSLAPALRTEVQEKLLRTHRPALYILALTFMSCMCLWVLNLSNVLSIELMVKAGLGITALAIALVILDVVAPGIWEWVYAHRRQVMVYGIVRPVFGFLGFCCGTNNRRSNILLFIVVPAACAYLVWIVALAMQAYIQHPLSEQLPNVVAGTETTLAVFREVPMSIGTFLVWLGGVILLTLFAIPYWVLARREEIQRGFLRIKHRIQTDSGSVIEKEEPGLVKQWFTTMLLKKQLHPAQQTRNTTSEPGTAPAKSGGMSGHTMALTLLTVAEVCDWIFTAFGKFFGGKND